MSAEDLRGQVEALQRRLRTREKQLRAAQAAHAALAAKLAAAQADVLGSDMAQQIATLRREKADLQRTVYEQKQRLGVYRREANAAPRVDPKPCPRTGTLERAFEKLEIA